MGSPTNGTRRHAASDEWLDLSAEDRWTHLATAWLAATRTPGLVGGQDAKGRALSALGPELDRSAAPDVRRRVLALFAELPPGTAPDAETLLRRLRWERPLRGGATPCGRHGHRRGGGSPLPPRPVDAQRGGAAGHHRPGRALRTGPRAAGRGPGRGGGPPRAAHPRAPGPRPPPGRPDGGGAGPAGAPARGDAVRPGRRRVEGRGDGVPLHARFGAPRPGRRAGGGRPARVPGRAQPYAGAAAAELSDRRRGPPPRPPADRGGVRVRTLRRRGGPQRDPGRPPFHGAPPPPPGPDGPGLPGRPRLPPGGPARHGLRPGRRIRRGRRPDHPRRLPAAPRPAPLRSRSPKAPRSRTTPCSARRYGPSARATRPPP